MKLFRVFNFSIDYSSDFSFSLTASIYNFSWFYNGEFLFLVVDPYVPIITIVKEEGNSLFVDVFSSTESVDKDDIIEGIRFILGVDENLGDFYRIWMSDKLLSKSYSYLRGFRVRCLGLWSSLLVSVCQQNASFRQGWTMLGNLYKLFGKRVQVGDYGYTILPPLPHDIINLDLSDLRRAKVGYRAEVIRNIAEAFVSEELVDGFDNIYSEDYLRRVRGVGSYSARLALMLTYRQYNLPPIDRWMKRIVSYVHDVPEKNAEETLCRIWGEYSGLACLITTIALDAEILSKALKRIDEGKVYPCKQDISPINLWRYI